MNRRGLQGATFTASVALILISLLTACAQSHEVANLGSSDPQTSEGRVGVREEAFPGRTGTGEPRSAYVESEYGPIRIDYEVIDGVAVLEGDIILGTADSFDWSLKNVGLWEDENQWSTLEIPYLVSSGLSATHKDWIDDAIEHWEENSQFTFVELTVGSGDYLNFTTTSACSSSVGRQGGAQNINIADCSVAGSVIHEIGHAIGLHHSHNRCDRDQHLIVYGTGVNYDKVCGSGWRDVAWYDSLSIMHYGTSPLGGGVNLTFVGGGSVSSQRDGLRPVDVQAVRELYFYSMSPAQMTAVLL